MKYKLLLLSWILLIVKGDFLPLFENSSQYESPAIKNS